MAACHTSMQIGPGAAISIGPPADSSSSDEDGLMDWRVQTQSENSNARRAESSSPEEAEKAREAETNVHVSGFPEDTNRRELASIFSQFGKFPMSIKKFSARCTYAIIRYQTEADAKEAITKAHRSRVHTVRGKLLNVRTYHTKPPVKIECTRSQQRGEIIQPEQIDLSGDFYKQMDSILSSIHVTKEAAAAVSSIYQDVERVLQEVFPECVAMPFGSLSTGLGMKWSDADLFVQLPDMYRALPGHSIINRASIFLSKHPTLFAEIIRIPEANTPIVKFFHLPTSTNCDLSFKSPLGVKNSQLIAFLLHADPRVLPLSVLIKYWAKVHGLSGSGKLTNYALTMMIIFYLQQPSVSILPPVKCLQSDPENDVIIDNWNVGFEKRVPPSTNTSSVPELLGGFFEYYSNFGFEKMVICPYLGEVVDKQLFRDLSELPPDFDRYIENVTEIKVPALKVGTPFVVQDPFDHSHNVASMVSDKVASDVRAFFEFAANCYATEKLYGCCEFLKTILLQKPTIYTSKRPRVCFGIKACLTINLASENFKEIVQKIVLDIFQNILKIELIKQKHTTNPETKKEKETYTGTLTKKIWKRESFTETYDRYKNMDFAEMQTKITEDIMNVEEEVLDIQFNFHIMYKTEDRIASAVIEFRKGARPLFFEFSDFLEATMNKWFSVLVNPYTNPS